MKQKIWGKGNTAITGSLSSGQKESIFSMICMKVMYCFRMQDNIHAELILGQTQERKEELKDPQLAELLSVSDYDAE